MTSTLPLPSTRIEFATPELMFHVLGPQDHNLRLLEKLFPALSFHVRGTTVSLSGPRWELKNADRVFTRLQELASQGTVITAQVIEGLTTNTPTPDHHLGSVILNNRGRSIRAKTSQQQHYVDSIDQHTVIFGIGPAGTGKTYLAMAKAVQALQRQEISRIILTRPAVEAGERLGFLPGSLHEKIDPYLRPLYDALHDMIDPESIPRLLESGIIEVAPLAYMRGRTLNDAFIILDEAQNSSAAQMKMFLTRLGFGSKMVVTGDASQVDLPTGTHSGLQQVEKFLTGIQGVDFIHLSADDVVRHQLVGKIVDAYARWEEEQTSLRGKKNREN